MNVKCVVCDGTDYTLEAGYYYCNECHTQTQELRECAKDVYVRGVTRRALHKRITTKKDHWTSWESYNYIVIGLVDELIRLGAPSEIQLTTLQLWTAYLTAIDVAFTSKNKPRLPKLSAAYRNKDVQVIYNRAERKRRCRPKLASSICGTSETNTELSEWTQHRQCALNKQKLAKASYEASKSEKDSSSKTTYASYSSNRSISSRTVERLKFNRKASQLKRKQLTPTHFKSHRFEDRTCHKFNTSNASSTYLESAYHLSIVKVYAILYLSLLINQSEIQLGDMLRFIREGHISFSSFKHFFPESMALNADFLKGFVLKKPILLTHFGVRKTAAKVANLIQLRNIPTPNISNLCHRYLLELQLPQQIEEFIIKLLSIAPPIMKFKKNMVTIPNYEARAIAYVIFTLKFFYGLDDATENILSNFASRLNSLKIPNKSVEEDSLINIINDNDLVNELGLNKQMYKVFFDWTEWLCYIECRKVIIMDQHFPTKHLLDPNGEGGTELFIKYWKKELDKEDYEEKTHKNMFAFIFRQTFEKLNALQPKSKTVVDFEASLTPHYSYLNEIIASTRLNFPDIIKNYELRVGNVDFILNPCQYIIELPNFSNILIKPANAIEKLNFVNIFQHRPKIKIKEDKLVLVNFLQSSIEEVYMSNVHKDMKSNEDVPVNSLKWSEINKKGKKKNLDESTFYQPFHEYWLHLGLPNVHINAATFSQIFQKLPQSFRWLMAECARLLEMTVRDIYTQLIFIEVYFAFVGNKDFETNYSNANNNEFNAVLLKRLLRISKKSW